MLKTVHMRNLWKNTIMFYEGIEQICLGKHRSYMSRRSNESASSARCGHICTHIGHGAKRLFAMMTHADGDDILNGDEKPEPQEWI